MGPARAEPPPRPPPDPSEEETVVDPEWPVRPESEVVVERTQTVPPQRRVPVIWPWLLALLLLVLGGLGALYYFTQDDDEAAPTTTAPATTAVELLRVPDVVGTTSSEATATLRDAGFEANVVPVPSDRPNGQVVAQAQPAGTERRRGDTVQINISMGPQPVTEAVVPGVVGRR